MEAARQNTSNDLHFRRPRVPQAAVVMVMSLALHTKDPDGVGGAINILLFPDLSPSVGLEDALLTRKCNMILGGGGGTLDYFSDTSMLMRKEKVTPIFGWVKVASQLEA